MPAKGRNNARAAELKVAKRGANQANAQSSQNAPSKAGPTKPADPATVSSAPNEPPAAEAAQPAQRRTGSGVSARKVSDGLRQLPQSAYQFVRESYLMLDSDGSGSVSKATMRDMLTSLGLQDSGDKRLDAMLERTGEPVTFASYLAVMGELLGELPTREELDMMLEAFQNKDGSIDERELRDALAREGVSAAEIDGVLRRFSKPTRHGQSFDAKKFASAMSI